MSMQNVIAARGWKSIVGLIVIVLAIVLFVIGRVGWFDGLVLALLGVILV